MKRRSFLTMLGAAVLTPALPVAAAPAPVATAYSRYMYGLAVFHARTHAHVSARGIAARLKVSPAQARAMVAEMTSGGLVKPVGMTGSNVRAVSNILKPDAWGLDRAARKARSQVRKDRLADPLDAPTVKPGWIAHLHDICRDRGMTLSPRCFAASGGLV